MNKKTANKSVEMQKAYLQGVRTAGYFISGVIIITFAIVIIFDYILL